MTRALTMAGCLLAAWIPVLALRMTAQRVDPATIAAWVSLDACELGALTALVLAARRRAAHTRIVGVTAATLLFLDAAVDVTSATTTNDLVTAMATAVCAELPVALGCLYLARTNDALTHDVTPTRPQPVRISS